MPATSGPAPHVITIRTCLERPEVLNAWELRFLCGLRDAPRLSARQHKTLAGLLSKVVQKGAPR